LFSRVLIEQMIEQLIIFETETRERIQLITK